MRVFFLIFLFSLSGCASYYKLPHENPLAKIELNTNRDLVIVQIFKDETCTEFSHGTRLAYLHSWAGDNLTGTVKEIEAGRELVIAFNKIPPSPYFGSFCQVSAGFTPEPGNNYRANFHIRGNACDLEIYNTTNDKNNDVPDESLRRLEKPCYNSITG